MLYIYIETVGLLKKLKTATFIFWQKYPVILARSRILNLNLAGLDIWFLKGSYRESKSQNQVQSPFDKLSINTKIEKQRNFPSENLVLESYWERCKAKWLTKLHLRHQRGHGSIGTGTFFIIKWTRMVLILILLTYI